MLFYFNEFRAKLSSLITDVADCVESWVPSSTLARLSPVQRTILTARTRLALIAFRDKFSKWLDDTGWDRAPMIYAAVAHATDGKRVAKGMMSSANDIFCLAWC